MVPLSEMTVHMRNDVSVNDRPAIRLRMRSSDAVSSAISTVPIE